jgi:hypothetical protein
LPALRKFQADGSVFDRQIVDALCRSPQLTTVWLSRIAIRAEDLTCLSQCRHITTLSLGNLPVSPAVARLILANQSLKSVTLPKAQIDSSLQREMNDLRPDISFQWVDDGGFSEWIHRI